MELRALMPGKVIKLLVQAGAAVEPGQGLIVVEAMKMQNEMKSPKKGIVSRIHAVEGATVVAGEALIVVE
jgi:biotin carboxyl carrier protein